MMKGAENTIGKIKTKRIMEPWMTEEMLRSNNAQRRIESKDGELLTDPHGIKKRWKEYTEMLYNKDGRPTELFVEEESEVDKYEIGPDIMRAEVLKAIEELKTGKAEGTDNIPAEMLKTLKGTGFNEIVILCQQMYLEGKWPEDFCKSVMVPSEKKTAAKKWEDHRTISLISHASQIMLKILSRRSENKKTDAIGQDQFGFIKGRGTREAITVMRILADRSIEHDQEVYVSFVDFEKAFDGSSQKYRGGLER
ncbi:uncharacterized protein LOC125028693 [Penaeus chinensis]|uniref:uncharacterized protein LOC125028693 n=1 Tax=Penaeus chinensis TaxID=139456 RepID=UPI001FB71CA7|nr:uncharacterized protein LOC125028693 [Penaeus chinensis]